MKNYLDHSFSTDDYELISIIDELPLWSAPFGLDLLDAVILKPNTIALDIGSGLGFPLIELAMRLGSTGKVFGIDPWERAIERTNLKVKVLNLKNVQVIKGVAEKMPFENNFFDLIVSNNGINNVEDLKQSLYECARVAKKGAQCVLTLNLEQTMMEFYEELGRTLDEHGLNKEIQCMKGHIYSKRKPLSEVESILNESGFKIKNIHHKSFKLDFLDGTTMFDHYLIKYWFLPEWKKILLKKDQEKVFDEVERRINQISAERGFFSLTVPYATIDCVRI